jgi:hypothetical protein
MRGMRNRMAHGYFEINLDIVWETVQQSLPELERPASRDSTSNRRLSLGIVAHRSKSSYRQHGMIQLARGILKSGLQIFPVKVGHLLQNLFGA